MTATATCATACRTTSATCHGNVRGDRKAHVAHVQFNVTRLLGERFFHNKSIAVVVVRLVVGSRLVQSQGQTGASSAAGREKNSDWSYFLVGKIGVKFFTSGVGHFKHGFLLKRYGFIISPSRRLVNACELSHQGHFICFWRQLGIADASARVAPKIARRAAWWSFSAPQFNPRADSFCLFSPLLATVSPPRIELKRQISIFIYLFIIFKEICFKFASSSKNSYCINFFKYLCLKFISKNFEFI